MKIKYYLEADALRVGCSFEPPRDGDAGYDICAAQDVYIYGVDWKKNKGNNRAIISTGLHVQIPDGFVGILKDRSSLASKALTISAGVIDPSYLGEILVIMQNNHYGGYKISAGNRIAQMLVVPYLYVDTEQVDSLYDFDETTRGDQGFGSTGI